MAQDNLGPRGMTARSALAVLSRVDPKRLVETEFDQHMLNLAWVFNDMHDHALFLEWLSTEPTDAADVSPYSGQHSGATHHLWRRVIGTVWDFIDFLEKKRTYTLPEFSVLLKRTPEQTQLAWKDLIRLVEVGPKPKAGEVGRLCSALVQIRNNASSHYLNLKWLKEGYTAYFKEGVEDPRRQHAYVSLGHSMEETRFYYADAAVLGVLDKLAVEHRVDLRADVPKVLRQLSLALGPILKLFVKSKMASNQIPTKRRAVSNRRHKRKKR